MKKWIHRIKNLFFSQKGETLIESIISLFILSIIMIAVTTMIQTAFRITNTSINNARETQEEVMNPLILSEYEDSEEVDVIFTYVINGEVKSASHKAKISMTDGITAISPQTGIETPGVREP